MVPTPQVCVSTLVTVSTMAVVDLYLLEQSMLGARGKAGPGVWPCAAVLLGDLGFLLALRFVSAGVVSEAPSPRRGFANALWFLFLSLLQLKLFFVCQNYRTERRPPDPLARKTLTLLLSVCLPSLFLILTGADNMTPLRRKQEVRGRLLWVVVDLLDVLDLQAGLWEAQTGATDLGVPLWAEGLVFFYCYALLLLLPCVALTELGAAALPGQRGPRKEALYPWLSLVTINVFTMALRGTGMLWYRDPRVSTVFLGKNLLALAVKLSSAWERHKQGGSRGTGMGAGAGVESSMDSTLATQSSEQTEVQALAKTTPRPPSRNHTMSRSHSHSVSHVSLDPTETSLGPSFISHEL
ncbi:transmembrane protein 121-like [Salvelinus fontinalis]|uniref:transmembrane protein 121-like n=1 Tax=Salvelinus fontinalis TaxID=8038 RepID=UPI0024864E24|nr:transmembrane protein 121-like [Salvelinus fontinalis]XP_055744779.1 transmembrane protein 121-like [Salvelinus fontinalis]